MSQPLETAELLAFAQTVEAKSLSRAAAELRVPRATISRRLARLEERLSTRLLRRTTRSLVLTDAGEALYRHARIVLDAVGHAEASVRRTDDVVRGDLRISAPPMLDRSFHDMFSGFARRFPSVRMQVHLSTQIVDLARGDYDVAIRASDHIQPGLVARTLVRDPVVAVASPTYLAKSGVPHTVRDLRQHRCLMGFARGEVPQTHWTAGGRKIHVEGAFFSNDMLLLCSVALQGLGIALMPLMLVRAFIESGALVHVLPGVLGGESHVAVVYPERQWVPPQVRAFVDTVVGWAKDGLKKGLPTADDCKPATRRAVPARTRATRSRVTRSRGKRRRA